MNGKGVVGGAVKIFTACCIAVLLSSCQEKAVSNSQSEPTGGAWKPALVTANDTLKPPSPPEAKSDQERKEVDELIALVKQRTPEKKATIDFWNTGASVRWNEIARDLVAKYRTDAPESSRIYSLLSVAQYDAAVAAWNYKYLFKRHTPKEVSSSVSPAVSTSGDPVYPSEHAAVASASAIVLSYLYPNEATFLESKAAEHSESRLWAGVNYRSDLAAGAALGRRVAESIVKYAQADGANEASKGVVSTGEGQWYSAPNVEPITPQWRGVKPWFMKSAEQFRPAPPPVYGSPEFKAAVAEVKQISDNITTEQSRIGAFWADGPGSYTPPGRWNKIAADLILKYGVNEIRAARVFALLNMAMHDVGVACFEAKYHYVVMRPSQADTNINLRLGLPNHPSYPSGHSCFSSAGAEVLSHLFPGETASLRAKADEAGMSRIYTGIHYRFDKEAGATLGRNVGLLAVERAQSDGSP